MTDTAEQTTLKPVSYVRYLIVTIVIMVLYGVVSYILASQFGIEIPNAVGIVLPMVAAMDAGQNYFNKNKVLPTKRYAWKTAFFMMLIQVSISVAILAVLISVLGPNAFVPLTDGDLTPMFIGISVGISIAAVLLFFSSRFMFMSGAKNQMKGLAKIEAKKAK